MVAKFKVTLDVLTTTKPVVFPGHNLTVNSGSYYDRRYIADGIWFGCCGCGDICDIRSQYEVRLEIKISPELLTTKPVVLPRDNLSVNNSCDHIALLRLSNLYLMVVMSMDSAIPMAMDRRGTLQLFWGGWAIDCHLLEANGATEVEGDLVRS